MTLWLVSLWGFYVRPPCSGIADKSISFSCWVFARYIFPVLVVYHQYMFQEDSLESDRWVLDRPGRMTQIETSIRLWIPSSWPISFCCTDFVQLYSFSILCWYLQYRWGFFDVGCIPVYVHLVCVDGSLFFCQYCWNVDGLGVAVELLCLRRFICRGADVICLCLNTSFVVTNGFPFRLPLIHTLGVSSPGGRWEVLLFLGSAGNFSCFFSLDPHQLDRYSAGINLQVPS